MIFKLFIDRTTINHRRSCNCGQGSHATRKVLGEILIDDLEIKTDDETPLKQDDSTKTGNAESSDSEDDKTESIVSFGSIGSFGSISGKSEVENEAGLNLRLSSDTEDQTVTNNDVIDVRKDSDSDVDPMLNRRSEGTGNSYFTLRVLTHSSFREC